MKAKLNKQKTEVNENKNSLTQSQSVKSISAPKNGINFTIQQKQAPVKNTTGLPDNLKSGIEHLSGIDISDVKVHYNSSQPAQLNAHAYAQGNQIHIAPGQQKHLAHEAWHVVQQKQGRVKATRQLKGKVNINDDAGLEKEADVMGKKAIEIYRTAAILAQRIDKGSGDKKSENISLSLQYSQPKAFSLPIIQKQIKNVYNNNSVVQRRFLIGNGRYGNGYGPINNNHIKYFDRLNPIVRNKIERWALKLRFIPFPNWNDVVHTALRVTGVGVVKLYVLRNFNTQLDNLPEPNPISKAGRKHWRVGVPPFVFGGGYYNTNDGRFKQVPAAGREVHATLNDIVQDDVRNELVAYVKSQPAWINRNEDVVLYTDNVDLQGWTIDRYRVGIWHISLYSGADRQGGWHEIDGNAALPNYNNNGGPSTAVDQASAANIRANMNADIL